MSTIIFLTPIERRAECVPTTLVNADNIIYCMPHDSSDGTYVHLMDNVGMLVAETPEEIDEIIETRISDIARIKKDRVEE